MPASFRSWIFFAAPQRSAACSTASFSPGGEMSRASSSGASPIESTRVPPARTVCCQLEKLGGKNATTMSAALSASITPLAWPSGSVPMRAQSGTRDRPSS